MSASDQYSREQSHIPYNAPGPRYPYFERDEVKETEVPLKKSYQISNLTVVESSRVTVWVRNAACGVQVQGPGLIEGVLQHTTDGALPVIIELVLHEAQDETSIAKLNTDIRAGPKRQ